MSITLPVFNNAEDIRVVVVGEDKAEAVNKGLKKLLPIQEFPVCGVRSDRILWMLDRGSAAQL
jgi:6-phosphogluconolactonase/glucosamine-6-phosphate isomerase/deaminase